MVFKSVFVCAFVLGVLSTTVLAEFPKDMTHLVDLEKLYTQYGRPTEYMVPMRDGVLLSTLVWFPRGANETGSYAAVLDRSPYGHFGTELLATLFLPFDFVAVLQDMRGAQQSEGRFTFWRAEGNDSYDTLKWISEQSWSNGRVYQMGFSADGMATLAGGINESPPWLKGQWWNWASATGYNSSFQGGAWVQGLLEGWLSGTGFPYSIPEVKAEEQYSEWWWPIDIADVHAGKCHWPSVGWGGWFDIFQQGSIDAYDNYQSDISGCSGQHSLFIDPHGHCGFFDAGEVYFPLSRLALPIFQAIDLFLTLEGREPRFNVEADRVTFYVMGPDRDTTIGNYWTTLPAFPRYTLTSYYLRNDGQLTTDFPRETIGRSTFSFDPSNPMPTLGGHLLSSKCGMYDQSLYETRGDVLTFSTTVLTTDLVVTGHLFAELYVSTSANDTDFLVKLLDVYPDGRAMFLADGIRRLRWRVDRAQPPVYARPGEVYKISIDLWSTSYIFAAGHSLRIHVSSSSSTRYSVNYNNGVLESDKDNSTPVVAENTVYFSNEYPSRIMLPVVNKSDVPRNFRPRVPRLKELEPFDKIVYQEPDFLYDP